jgi:hypothetical protein
VHLRILSLFAALVAAVVVVGGSGAGTAKLRGATKINVSTRSAVIHYLRSIHVNPRGVVIQRGKRNYAGARCPGKGWTCTSTKHTVVQVAAPGGKNTYNCSTANCAVVQVATTATATNTAKCVKTSGFLQACFISQTSSSANNVAIVVETTTTSGLAQLVALGADIRQKATGASNSNTACVLQTANATGSTSTGGSKVTVAMEAHQAVRIVQDSAHGGNTVQNASAAGGGSCVTGPLTQGQTLTSNVKGTGSITQLQNAANLGANVWLQIEQNQSSGFFGTATGPNSAVFNQTNSLTAVANTSVGPVKQTQSSVNGGIFAHLDQDSRDVSTADATQMETQCEDAHLASGPFTCHTATPDPPGYSLTQTQFGPMRKAGNDSQTGNAADTFIITQNSKQDNDTGNGQTNVVEGECHTDGNCTVAQTTTVQGVTTTNVQSGQDIDTTITCTGTACTPTCTGASCVTPDIIFDGSPGTAGPPPTLGPYAMTAFGADPQPLGSVSGVNDPAGTISFSTPLNHDRIGQGWATWSHGYTGDVYDTCFTGAGCAAADPSTVTINLPAGTQAFYFYAEPNNLSPFTITAMAQDGTTSGPVTVDGNGGARYFGFYGVGGATLASITITADDPLGFAVGEFGISPAAGPPIG